jgi:hypothetical protein
MGLLLLDCESEYHIIVTNVKIQNLRVVPQSEFLRVLCD